MDIWQRLVTRDMPHGQLELLDRAADEIAQLRAENDSLIAELIHLRSKLDHIAQCARWDLEPRDHTDANARRPP